MIYLQVWKPINIDDNTGDWIWNLEDELACTSRKDATWKARCYHAIGKGVFRLEIVEK